jgi:hypothetical protein
MSEAVEPAEAALAVARRFGVEARKADAVVTGTHAVLVTRAGTPASGGMTGAPAACSAATRPTTGLGSTAASPAAPLRWRSTAFCWATP